MPAINRITDDDIAHFSRTHDIDHYQNAAIKSAIYPGIGTPFGLAYCALKLNGEAGELAEHVGKAMRDDKLFEILNSSNHHDGLQAHTILVTPLTESRREFLIKEIGDCLWYLSALCKELGITLFEAAFMNLRKLKDRTDRNALQGSGDNR